MTSKIVVNNIEADAGVSTVTFGSNISGNFVGSISVSGVTTVAAGSASAPSISPTGDSNTGIFFPSADTIGFAEGGVEAARFDSSGRLGIGTNNPQNLLEVFNGNLKVTGTSAANRSITIDPGSNTTYDSRIDASHSLVFRSYVAAGAGVKTCTFNTNGDIDLTSGRNLIFASGNGIDFSATSNSSGTMSSELLSDYEQGSFTPSWGSSVSAYTSPSPTYNNRYGNYTKIGNIVLYDIQLETTAWNGAGSTLWAWGLPFTTRSSGYQQGGGGIFCITGVDNASAITNLTTQIAPNTTRIELYFQTAAAGANYNEFTINHINEASTVSIRISGHYFTD